MVATQNRCGRTDSCWGLLFGLANAIDHSAVLLGASAGPLDTPILKGPTGRSLAFQLAKKTKIANIAAKGAVFKTPRGVIRRMKALGQMQPGEPERGANKWTEPLAWRSLHEV